MKERPPVGRRRQWARAASVLAVLAVLPAGCAGAAGPLASSRSGAGPSADVSADQPLPPPGFGDRPGRDPSVPDTGAPGGPGTPAAGPADGAAEIALVEAGRALPPPDPLVPFVTPPLAGEGEWRPAGRWVDGYPAVFVTTLRADGGPPDPVAGVAWMDTKLVRATLYSGSVSPGGGPWRYSAPIEAPEASVLVCAFNGGFKMADARGGYFSESKTVVPLVSGAASFVVYRDGSSALGVWGRDVTMTPDVVAVRQNLTLLVDGGQPVADLSPGDAGPLWGSTLGHVPHVYRSGLGIRADGSLVYVAAPSLDVVQLAHLLVRAGSVRAMQLDINPLWPTFATYAPILSQTAAPANGTDLLPSMAGGPGRFFTSWGRDFITLSSREAGSVNHRQLVQSL